MFDKIARTPKKTAPTAKKAEMPLTVAFLTCVRDNGARLSYAALAIAARQLGEDVNGQIPAQRGATLIKGFDAALHPYVCRKAGGYAKGRTWDVEVPADLAKRSVIIAFERQDGLDVATGQVAAAITVWRDSLAN